MLQKLEMKIFMNGNFLRKSEIIASYLSEHYASFGTTHFSDTPGGKEGGLVVLNVVL